MHDNDAEIERDRRVDVRLERREDGRLWAEHDSRWTAVRACSCFPWTERTRYVSLRDDNDREVALITDLDRLDARSRRLVENALAEAHFVLEIERIDSIEEEFEIRNWKVQTRQGPRTFQTELDEWPRELPGGGILIKDVAGDLFHVPRLDQLDEDSRKLIWAFAD